MIRRVEWSRDAIDDIKTQAAYIAQDSYAAAIRVAKALQEIGEKLGAFSTGRPGRTAGTYEKSVPRLPYVIVYAIRGTDTGETLTILRVIHSARDWPGGGWPGVRP